MLELREVSLSFGARAVLDRVSLTCPSDELTVVAGATGSGKSTLLGVMAGVVPRFGGGTLSGQIVIAGDNVTALPARERAHLVGYVGQDTLKGFVTDTVEEEIAFGMEQLGYRASTMRRRVEETMDLLSLADLRHRELRTLSGGQQQRVAIGSVIATHPQILLLDEPTSALDPIAAEEVLATLARLVGDSGLAVVIAEHRLERVLPFADQVISLDRSGQASVGPVATELVDLVGGPPLLRLARYAEWSPPPLSVREARRRARDRDWGNPPAREASAGATTVRVRDAWVKFGSTSALAGVNFECQAGQVCVVMGRNGSGKSTLLWALQGQRALDKGEVAIEGANPAKLSEAQRRERAGLVPQTASDLLFLETVGAECESVPGSAELLTQLAPVIELTSHPRDLSEGQQLALVLALVLAPRPPVVLLDEPTRGLDYRAKSALAAILGAIKTEGKTVVVTTHDVEFAALVADRVVVMAQGEVIADGAAGVVLAQSPAFAPQLSKVLGEGWLTPDDLMDPPLAQSAGQP